MGKITDKNFVFVDRDGCVNVRRYDPENPEKNYVCHWDQFEWMPGAKEALARLANADYGIIVISNQSGINKGVATVADVNEIFVNMFNEVAETVKSEFQHFQACICPHISDEDCSCRKPKPGMIYHMAYRNEIRLRDAWLVGDQGTDTLAGWNAGIRKLIRTDSLEEQLGKEYSYEETVNSIFLLNTPRGRRVPTLANAVDYIIRWDKENPRR